MLALGTRPCTHSKEGYPNKSRSQDSGQELYLAGTQTPPGGLPASPWRLLPTELLMPGTTKLYVDGHYARSSVSPTLGTFPVSSSLSDTGLPAEEVGCALATGPFLLQARLPNGCIRLSTSARGTSGS